MDVLYWQPGEAIYARVIYMLVRLDRIQRRVWPVLAGLALLLGLLLWFSPTERTLGQTVKLVYLHGALVRTAMALFAISLPINLVALLGRQGAWSAWGTALAWTALVVWVLHTLFSMVTTYAAWGVFIAWFEPRTRFTFTLAAVGLIVVTATLVVDDVRFSGLAFCLLAGLTLVLAPRLGVIQHPLDPIGSSPSSAIRTFYTAIQVVCLAMGGLLAIWLQMRLASLRQ
jgi:hypothetical protein